MFWGLPSCHIRSVRIDKTHNGQSASRKSLTPKQAQAARALLSWSPEHLAREAGLGLSSVYDVEAGRRNVSPESLGKLQQALERGGIQFINGAKSGVRLVG